MPRSVFGLRPSQRTAHLLNRWASRSTFRGWLAHLVCSPETRIADDSSALSSALAISHHGSRSSRIGASALAPTGPARRGLAAHQPAGLLTLTMIPNYGADLQF